MLLFRKLYTAGKYINKKVSSCIVQYPIHRTAQGELHVTPWQTCSTEHHQHTSWQHGIFVFMLYIPTFLYFSLNTSLIFCLCSLVLAARTSMMAFSSTPIQKHSPSVYNYTIQKVYISMPFCFTVMKGTPDSKMRYEHSQNRYISS